MGSKKLARAAWKLVEHLKTFALDIKSEMLIEELEKEIAIFDGVIKRG